MNETIKQTILRTISYILPALIAFIIIIYVVRAIIPDWIWGLMA